MKLFVFFRCSLDDAHSCPQGYFCRILDDLTKTACCPGIDQALFIRNGQTRIINPSLAGTSGSGSIYSFNNGHPFPNVDYLKSQSVVTSIGSVLPVEPINYANQKSINSNEFLPAIVASGVNPEINPVGVPYFARTGSVVDSHSAIPKNYAVTPEAVSSGSHIFPGGSISPMNPGLISIGHLSGTSAGISNEFNNGAQNYNSNSGIGAIRKFLTFVLPLSHLMVKELRVG